MFHGVILPVIFLGWLFGHGIGSIFGLLILIWVLGMIFHPWRWGYHPYYSRSWRWGSPPPPASSPSNARSILEERYAKGDITREEYLQKKQDLGGL
jgi:putative membrane protein